MTASGHLGAKIKVAGESLILSGHLQPPKGENFPAVVLSDRVNDLGGIEDGQPDVMAIELLRLSDIPADPLFNEYIASPFVLSLGKLNSAQAAAVGNINGRQVMLSGSLLRFSPDPDDGSDIDLDPWESRITDKILVAGVHRSYQGLAAQYLESQNPSPLRGSPRLAGVDLQTGEFSTVETDMQVAGRHQDLALVRSYESRSEFTGASVPGGISISTPASSRCRRPCRRTRRSPCWDAPGPECDESDIARHPVHRRRRQRAAVQTDRRREWQRGRAPRLQVGSGRHGPSSGAPRGSAATTSRRATTSRCSTGSRMAAGCSCTRLRTACTFYRTGGSTAWSGRSRTAYCN